MKVFFDTNVILDALTERDNSYRPSQRLVRYVVSGSITGYISAKQLTDIYYCLKKYFSDEKQRRKLIRVILDTFEIIPTLKSDIRYCLNSDIKDLEDALIDEICHVNCIDYLVTNNVKDFQKGKSVLFTPEQLVTILEVEK